MLGEEIDEPIELSTWILSVVAALTTLAFAPVR